jgi:hypothetical protein
MQYILHDLHVAVWAMLTRHPHARESKLAIDWPLHIQRAVPQCNSVFYVRIHRPRLHLLNAYEVERAFNAAHKPANTAK